MEHFQEAEHITMLRDTVRRFVENEMPRAKAQEWDRENAFPREIFDQLSALPLPSLSAAARPSLIMARASAPSAPTVKPGTML